MKTGKSKQFGLSISESTVKTADGVTSASIWDRDANLYRPYWVSCSAAFGTKAEALAFVREMRRNGADVSLPLKNDMRHLEGLPEALRTYVPGRLR